MKFSTREDIALPIDEVFGILSDFEWMERAALRRGAQVTRVDTLAAPGAGMAWTAEFTFRGKRRAIRSELTNFLPPENIVLQSSTGELTGISTIDLFALSPRRTRMAIAIELWPNTIPGRVLLQTLRLGRTQMSERFTAGVTRFARELEAGTFRRPGA